MMKYVWLSKHLLSTCLRLTNYVQFQKERLQAEIHCLFALLYRQQSQQRSPEPIVTIEEALYHLTEARELSKDEPWHFNRNVIIMKIQNVIDLHGLRQSEQILVDLNNMSCFLVASLLLHEMLFKLADQILFSESNSMEEEVKTAMQYAERAIQLALDVRESSTINSALVRYGGILRDNGAWEDAMNYFNQTCLYAQLNSDKITEAIGFHGLGTCFNLMKNPLRALEMFALEYEVGIGISDIQAEALRELAKIQLMEGQVSDAEECFLLSHKAFLDAKQEYDTPQHLLDEAWGLIGLGIGYGQWGRLAGLIRKNTSPDLKSLVDFKNLRTSLIHLKRPEYTPKLVKNEYHSLEEESPQPGQEQIHIESTHPSAFGDEQEDIRLNSALSELLQNKQHNIHHQHCHHHPESRKKMISFNDWQHPNSDDGLGDPQDTDIDTLAVASKTIFDSDMIYESDMNRGNYSTTMTTNTSILNLKSEHGTDTSFRSAAHRVMTILREKDRSASFLKRFNSMSSTVGSRHSVNRIPSHLLSKLNAPAGI